MSRTANGKVISDSPNRILITGHEGLIGRYLWNYLLRRGFTLKGIDNLSSKEKTHGDITNQKQLSNAISCCCGIVHLAAVSRVIWGEQNPGLCWRTNVEASREIFQIAMSSPCKPWVLTVSSREVYGECTEFPVTEGALLRPINAYGKAKLSMEKDAFLARQAGLKMAVVRLSNVYGCVYDHVDRVIPAFCRAAVQGEDLRVDGGDHCFDFTHISDVIEGLYFVIKLLIEGRGNLPAIHLLPGIATTLNEAAEIAVRAAGSSSKVYEAMPRNNDVAYFYGDPSLANEKLGWQAKITPGQGIPMLVNLFRQEIFRKNGGSV